MKYKIDPQQTMLFDPDLAAYSTAAQRRLLEDWPGLFRSCLLELMPVDETGSNFDETMGRPTKELYSICGLLLLMEFNDWTVEQAADAYMFDGRVQFALNLGRDRQSISTRSIERYQKIFRDQELGKEVNDRVTECLVDLLDLKVDKLRLDSTHVFSNMASFGRTRLMLTATRRFLTQLKRHEAELYGELSAELRERYSQKTWEFGKGNSNTLKREDIAEDMHFLIARFESNERVFNRTTFQDLFRVFTEQCDVVEEKIVLRKKTGANTMQNPSDPDATFDGKKGSGYQVQVAETCSEENDTQLIVGVIPQTAGEHDQNAVETVLDELERNEINASTIVADAGYGGDPNFRACQKKGINLIAPVIRGGMDADRIQLSEFNLDGCCITACTMGHSPLKAWFDEKKDRGSAVFAAELCENCEHFKRCRVTANTRNYSIGYDGRALRNSLRRARLESDEAELYAKRSGVEATFSEGKRSTGMDRLRVRGQRSVFHAILGRITGINIKRAAKSEKIQQIVKRMLKRSAVSALSKMCNAWIRLSGAYKTHLMQYHWPKLEFRIDQKVCR